jgi:hypothetical protein
LPGISPGQGTSSCADTNQLSWFFEPTNLSWGRLAAQSSVAVLCLMLITRSADLLWLAADFCLVSLSVLLGGFPVWQHYASFRPPGFGLPGINP